MTGAPPTGDPGVGTVAFGVARLHAEAIALAWLLAALLFGTIVVGTGFHWPQTLMFAPAAVFAGVKCLHCLRWLVGRRPVLVIDRHGLFDRRVMRETVPWSEVTRVVADAHLPLRDLLPREAGIKGVIVTAPAWVARQRGAAWRRRLRRLVGPSAAAADDIVVDLAGLAATHAELVAALERLMPVAGPTLATQVPPDPPGPLARLWSGAKAAVYAAGIVCAVAIGGMAWFRTRFGSLDTDDLTPAAYIFVTLFHLLAALLCGLALRRAVHRARGRPDPYHDVAAGRRTLFRQDGVALGLVVLIGVLTTAVSVQAIRVGGLDWWFAPLFGVLAGLTGIATLAYGRRLFWRGPVLAVDATGIFDRRTMVAPLSWERVGDISGRFSERHRLPRDFGLGSVTIRANAVVDAIVLRRGLQVLRRKGGTGIYTLEARLALTDAPLHRVLDACARTLRSRPVAGGAQVGRSPEAPSTAGRVWSAMKAPVYLAVWLAGVGAVLVALFGLAVPNQGIEPEDEDKIVAVLTVLASLAAMAAGCRYAARAAFRRARGEPD